MSNASEPRYFQRLLGGDPQAVVFLMMLLFGLVGGGFSAYVIWTDYNETLTTTERITQDLASLLEEHTGRTLEAANLTLLRIVDRLEGRGLVAMAGNPGEADILRQMVESSDEVSILRVYDDAGKVRLTSGRLEAEVDDVRERDYFQALKTGAESFIGEVRKDPENGTYSFTLARRLNDASGHFVGVAAASIETSYFNNFYHHLNLGISPGLGVYRLDGAILAREPMPESDIGRNMSSNPVYTTYLPKAPIGTYKGRSAFDGVVRVVSYRKMERPELLVWVAVSETAALEDWKARVARHGVLMVGALAVIVVLSLLALRGIRRERLAAANLEMLNKRLYSTNLELERYAEVAAHHLQEPLRIINSYAQLLESRFSPKLQGECKEFLDFLVQGSREMKELLSDLQFYTALDPIGTPVTTSADAGHCAREALKDLKNTPQIETVSLGKLPTVKAVPRQLTILFQLLIHNALTYTSPDRVPVVTVSAEPDEAGWRFTVRDNGIGVEPAYRERIFRMFERLHPRGKYPGTGIGLAICRKIVERHGGRIWCDSNPGEGSAFSFTLPAAPVPTP